MGILFVTGIKQKFSLLFRFISLSVITILAFCAWDHVICTTYGTEGGKGKQKPVKWNKKMKEAASRKT